MDPSRWERLEELLAAGGELPPGERAAFVERETGGDPMLRAELTSLLAVYDRSAEYVSRLRRLVVDTNMLAILREPPGAADAPDPWTGRTVSHYEVTDRIGGGGMGVIYRARDLRLDRPVAVKFIAPELRRDSEARRRFHQEARAASALDHPNICTIHDIGETEDGRSFIVMAAYEGETLRDLIARGALPPAKALDLGEQVARALAAAHERDIVHRDVKPDNIFVTHDGVVKLLDFGLAGTTDAAMSGAGGVEGTVAYMSPEQAEGRRADKRSDTWALGVVLYEMMAGIRPFAAENPGGVIQRILTSEPDLQLLPSDLPAGVVTLVARALAKEPEARFADGGRFLRAVRECRAGLPAERRGQAQRHRTPLAAAGTLGLLLLLAAGFWWSTAHGRKVAVASAAPVVVTVSHILWVDDNPGNNAELIGQLQAQGIRAMTALSTAEALDRYDPAVHALVVSDMTRYEGANREYVGRAGLQLLERLRARQPDVALVFYTSAQAASARGGEALAAGALAIVHDEAELLRLINRVARGSRPAPRPGP